MRLNRTQLRLVMRRLLRPTLPLALGFAVVGTCPAMAQPAWEVRVCADPDAPPMSGRETPGYDNRIAAVLADAMGASPSFRWIPAPVEDVVRLHLNTGECDVIMGVGEGEMDLLTTVPYYRTPYVFVTRRDRGLEVRSLDDDVLTGLRVSTYASSVPHRALVERGHREIVTHNSLGPAPDLAILDDVIRGDADVDIVYGPPAGHAAKHERPELRIDPVLPELDPPLSKMYSVWTAGVRPHDEALRDRLNLALAARWDEIVAILEEYGVPLSTTVRPRAPFTESGDVLRVGVVLPLPTGLPRLTDAAGWAARVGASLAEGWIDRDGAGPTLEVLFASAPDSASAVRAAERLVGAEAVVALVGGIGPGQAAALDAVAGVRDALFFNIGSTADAFRDAAGHGLTFHVEAEASRYAGAIVRWFASEGHRRWFIVHDVGPASGALRDGVIREVESAQAPGVVAGVAGIARGERVLHEVLDRIRGADPDVVLLLMEAEDQEFFLSAYERAGLRASILGVPEAVSQTREFYARTIQVAPNAAAALRVALWDTTLPGAAAELNERFMGRSGEPMDPAGWAAYAAVRVVYEAVSATRSRAARALAEYLEHPETRFDLGKGAPLSFDPAYHQLRQPLYLVRIDGAAELGARLSQKVELAEVVAELLP